MKSDTSPTFIAEVSSNHSRDLGRCIQFVETAAEIGCDAVKFQLFKIDQMFAPEILARSEMHRARAQWELPLGFLPEIKQACEANNIQFGCTPFYLEAVDELVGYVDFFKVASYELTWDGLLAACGNTGKPVMLSTGMATLDEVMHAATVLRAEGNADLTLLHCVSDYPTRPEDCNLAAIATLRDKCDTAVGWSDHSVNPGVIYRAVHHWNARVIEFHLDLDERGEEFKSGHCWLPEQMAQVIQTVRCGFISDGNGNKVPAMAEMEEREWRADPEDGLRPFTNIREQWRKRAPDDESTR